MDRSTTIDNASTDETPALFASDAEFDDPLIHYIRLAKNPGGAGGFKEGMRRAAEAGNDWCWIMDDDVIPEQDAPQGLLDAHSYLASKDIAPSYLASCVYGPHGEVMNVPNISRHVSQNGYADWCEHLPEDLARLDKSAMRHY